MKLPAYPCTKPSGVEWLGDVPEHWEVNPVRRLVKEHRQGYYSDASYVDSGVKLLRITDLHEAAQIDYSECPRVESLPTLHPFFLKSGDFVFARTGGAGTFGVVERLDEPAVYASYLIRFRFDERANTHFLKYFFLSLYFREGVRRNIHGGVNQNVHAEDIKNQISVLPPVPEQATIAAYLDRETGRLDRLVGRKRELIERLKEKRTALISRTVTRGLPPAAARAAGLPENPPLKPSGLDWLGDIPTHWDTVPGRYAFYNLDHRRIPVAGEDRANVEKVYPYYGASGIIDHVEDYLFDETLILVAEDGANLLSRSSPLAFLASGKYWVNNHAHILKPIAGDIRYWAAVLQTYDYTPLVTGAAQPKLTSERLGGIRLPKPPLEEQAAIAAYLDLETAKLDALVGKVEAAVERLQEYRTALITAAVTGKIDVRKQSVSG